MIHDIEHFHERFVHLFLFFEDVSIFYELGFIFYTSTLYIIDNTFLSDEFWDNL